MIKQNKTKKIPPVLSFKRNHMALNKTDQKLPSDFKMTPADGEIMTSHVSTGSSQA